jgi:hypothetical protein
MHWFHADRSGVRDHHESDTPRRTIHKKRSSIGDGTCGACALARGNQLTRFIDGGGDLHRSPRSRPTRSGGRAGFLFTVIAIAITTFLVTLRCAYDLPNVVPTTRHGDTRNAGDHAPEIDESRPLATSQ